LFHFVELRLRVDGHLGVKVRDDGVGGADRRAPALVFKGFATVPSRRITFSLHDLTIRR
jgi:hypothetical protein